MRQAFHRWVLALGLLAGAINPPVSLAAAPTADAPWLAPENAEKYIFLGKQVWDIDAGKMIAPTGAPDSWDTSHWIVGVKDRLFDQPPSSVHPAGMIAPGRIVHLDGSMPQVPMLDGQMGADNGGSASFWINADHRRVVWIQGGDYWRGEIDWNTCKIVNRKQVTTIGSFNAANKPLLWWDQVLLVYGNFDKTKPIVRIDLAGGQLTEMETYHAFTAGPDAQLMVTPDVSRVFSATVPVIYCYDVRTGKPSVFRNKFELMGGKIPLAAGGAPPIWSDDDNCYSLDSLGYLSRLDFRNSRMDILAVQPTTFYGQPQLTRRIMGIVPGTHLIDLGKSTQVNPHANDQTQAHQRFLLDVTSNQETQLPFDDLAPGKWLDSSKFLYVLNTGGLSTIGTWIYDRAANTNKHLTGIQIDEGRMVYLPKRNIVMAISQQTGGTLVRLNLDGTPAQSLGQCGLDVPRHMPEPDDVVDLGLGGGQSDLWKPVAVDEKAIAATQPAEPAAGKVKLLELTKDMPQGDRDFAASAYDYCDMNSELSSYCDPIKWAMAALQAHKISRASPLGNIAYQVKLDGMGDVERISQRAHDNVLGEIAGDTQMTPEQKIQIVGRTTELVAQRFTKENTPPTRINDLIQQCLAQAKHEIAGAPAPQLTPTNATAQQQQQPSQYQQQQQQAQYQQQQYQNQQQQSQQQQSQQAGQHPTPVEQSIEKAKKARDAANQLHGLFGH